MYVCAGATTYLSGTPNGGVSGGLESRMPG